MEGRRDQPKWQPWRKAPAQRLKRPSPSKKKLPEGGGRDANLTASPTHGHPKRKAARLPTPNGGATKAGQPTPENHRCHNPQNTDNSDKPTSHRTLAGTVKTNPQKKTGGDNQQPFRRYEPTTWTTQARQTQDKTAQRYGKGRAASESQTKPPNPDKKLNFKTANGRRVPLTDLLCCPYKTP